MLFYFVLISVFSNTAGLLSFYFSGSHPGNSHSPQKPKKDANQNPRRIQGGHRVIHIVYSYCLYVAIKI